MGNAMTVAMAALCFQSNSSTSSSSVVKLVFWEGTTTILKPTSGGGGGGGGNSSTSNNNHHQQKFIAGEILFQFPDKMICHADSFYIGQTVPSLSISDQLLPGETYFVLPIDLFAFKNLSISSLSALGNSCSSSSSSSSSTSTVNFSHEAPFQYVKGVDGRMLIKVLPEFLLKLINTRAGGGGVANGSSGGSNSFLCSTPELRKHYDLLVGSKVWSPKLETISEANKTKFSPYRLIGKLDRPRSPCYTSSN